MEISLLLSNPGSSRDCCRCMGHYMRNKVMSYLLRIRIQSIGNWSSTESPSQISFDWLDNGCWCLLDAILHLFCSSISLLHYCVASQPSRSWESRTDSCLWMSSALWNRTSWCSRMYWHHYAVAEGMCRFLWCRRPDLNFRTQNESQMQELMIRCAENFGWTPGL